MRRKRRSNSYQPRINRNHYIRAETMRVIAEDGEPLGVMSKVEALELAKKTGKDLVEINASSDPVIVKLIEFGKFKYEKDKKKRESKRTSQSTETKQIRVSMKIGDGDLDTKLRKLRGFLEDGNRVRLSMMLKGRENAHKDLGVLRIKEISDKISEYAEVEVPVRLAGRNISVIYKPASSTKVKVPKKSVNKKPPTKESKK